MNNIEIIKQPDTEYAVHPLVASRWSPRAYDSKPVEPEKMQRIFEAARWSASSSNLQPWYFLVGFKGDEVYSKIFDSLVEFNRLWVIHAPVLVLGIAKTTNAKGDVNMFAAYDLGQALAILSLQAREEGVYTHQMGGFDSVGAESSLDIPEGYRAIVAFTIGYLGNAEILHPNLLKLEMNPRVRKPVKEFVFSGSFGQRAHFL